jgi:hypothetical protein
LNLHAVLRILYAMLRSTDLSRRVLRRALAIIEPGDASRRPTLFLLEIGTALLAVLAVRDRFFAADAGRFESIAAIALACVILVFGLARAVREELGGLPRPRRRRGSPLR